MAFRAHTGFGEAASTGDHGRNETSANAKSVRILRTARTVPRTHDLVLPSRDSNGGGVQMHPLRALIPIFIAGSLSLFCSPSEDTSTGEAAGGMSQADKNELAVIEVTDFGEIRLKFYSDKAPKHVENFKKLARDGFYDGVAFHRIVPGFVIQGGDPNTKDSDPSNDGRGGPGYNINAEFNDVPHKRGILSMARKADPDSAGSQFFIVIKDAPFLDGKYTVFGEAVSGMDVVDRIAAQPKGPGDRPLEPITMKSVRIVPGS
jgi:peptidyl-prolyl cis-trans isomerase B (cyclophilin B)